MAGIVRERLSDSGGGSGGGEVSGSEWNEGVRALRAKLAKKALGR